MFSYIIIKFAVATERIAFAGLLLFDELEELDFDDGLINEKVLKWVLLHPEQLSDVVTPSVLQQLFDLS